MADEFKVRVKAELDQSSINRLQTSINDIGKNAQPNIQLNISQAEQQIANLRNQLESLSNININIGRNNNTNNFNTGMRNYRNTVVETGASIRDLERLQRELISTSSKLGKLKVEGNTKGIEQLKRNMGEVLAQYYEMERELRTTLPDNAFNGIQRNAEKFQRAIKEINATKIDKTSIENATNAFNRLQSISREIKSKQTKLLGLDASSDIQQIEALEKRINELKSEYDTLYNNNKGSFSSKQNASLKLTNENLTKDLDIVKKHLEDIRNSKNIDIAEKIKTNNVSKSISDVDVKIKKLQSSGVQLGSELQKEIDKLKQMGTALNNSVKGGNFDNLTNQLKEYDRQLEKVKNDLSILENENKTFGTSVGSVAQSLTTFALSYVSIQQVFSAFKDGVKFVNELDDALTNIHYTMDVTKSQLEEVANSSIDMANNLKTSTSNVLQSVTLYANAKESSQSILDKSKTAIQLANVTGMQATDAAKMLQSIMNQFKLTEDDLVRISDVVQTVSQNMAYDFSAGIQELAEGIQVSGSVAQSAGLSFEEYASMLGVTIEQTGLAGSQIANAYRTIFLRTTKAGKAFGTLEEDISKSEESLRSVGVQVRSTEGEFRPIQDILTDLAGKWENLTEVQQNNITYNMAGIRQTNILTSLLKNFESYESIVNKANNAEGTTARNQQIYAESMTATFQDLKNSMEAFWKSFINAPMVEAFISVLTSVVDVITKISEATEGLSNVVAMIGIAKLISNIKQMQVVLSATGKQASSLQALGYVIKDFSAKVATGISTVGGLKGAIKGLFGVISKHPIGLIITACAGAFIGMRKLAEASAKASQASQEVFEEKRESYNTSAEETQNLNALIEKYKELKKQKNNSETRTEIKGVQQEITDLVGKQAENLDLVNGKLDEQISKLEQIKAQSAEDTLEKARDAYISAIDASKKASSQEDSYLFGISKYDYVGKYDEKAINIFRDKLNGASYEMNGWTDTLMINAQGSNAQEKADYIKAMQDALSKDKDYNTSDSELFTALGELKTFYQTKADQVTESIASLLTSTVSSVDSSKTDLDNFNVDSLEEYKKYREEFIAEVKNSEYLQEAIGNGSITDENIETEIDSYLSTIKDFSEYYEEYIDEINSNSDEINFDTLKGLFSEMSKGSEKAKAKLEEVAHSYGLTLQQLEKDVSSHNIAQDIQNLWDSEAFKDSREDLESLASSSKITASDIEDLAVENVELQSILNETGMSAEYLANIFNNMSLNGTDAFSNITTDALSLNEVLSSMKDELNAVDVEYSTLQKQLKEPDYDTQFNYYTDAYKSLAESFKNGEYGKNFFANAEFLFGNDANTKSIDQLYEKFKKLSSVFGDEADNGFGFIEKLYNNKDILKGLESSVELKDDGTYIWDIKEEELDKIAKGLGMTKNAIVACIEATGMYGDLNNYDLDELVETFKGLNSVMTTSDGIAVSSVQNVRGILETLGYTNREIEKIIKNLKSSEEVKLFDFEVKDEKQIKKTLEGITDLTGYDFTNKSAIKLKELLPILANNFGLTEKQAKSFVKTLSKNGYVFEDTTNKAKDLEEAISIEYNSSALKNVVADLDTVKKNAETAVKTLNELDFDGKEEIGELSFDFDDTSIDSVEEQLKKAEKLKEKFVDEDGELNLSIKGANECANIIIGLLKQKQELTKPDVMKINADFAEGEVYQKVKKIQDFVKANNNYELELKAGLDTTASKKARDEALEILRADNEINTTMNVDTSSVDTALETIKNITTEDWTVKYNVDKEKISEYEKSDKDQEANVIYDLKKSDELTSFLNDNHNIEAKVNFEIGKGKDIFEATKKTTVTVNVEKKSSSSKKNKVDVNVNGTANAQGTANARGDWRVGKDTDSLVGELGEEMIIRNGKYFTVGKDSAEMVHLQKNDIVLNHVQTKQLLENGKIRYGQPRGKLVGASVVGSAFSFGSISKNKKTNADNYVKNNTTKKSTGTKTGTSTNTSDNKTDKKLETFQDWIGKFVDWIEIRLSRLQTKIDSSIEKAERYIEKGNSAKSYETQNKQYAKAKKEYKSAIKNTYALIEANKKGGSKYTNQANKVANKAVKDGLVSQKQMNSIKKKVANGTIDISKYGERQQEIIKDYQDYYEKALDCANATTSLNNQLDEYYNSLYNLPIDKATNRIDKLSESLDRLSAKAEAVNGGGTLYNKTVVNNAKNRKTSAENDYNEAKKTQTKAKKAQSKSQAKVKSTSNALKNSKQLTKAQKAIVKNGTETISTKGLTGSALKQAKAYNKAVKLNNANKEKLSTANKSVTETKQIKNTATSEYNKAVATSKKYKNADSYLQENDILEEENNISKQEMNERNKALKTTNKNVVDAQKTKDTTTNKVEKTKKALSKVKLSSSQKKQLNSGTAISTKGLSGNALKKVQAYNKALEEQKKASTALTKAKNAQTQATTDLAEAEAEYTTTVRENTNAMLENVENSYNARLELNDSETEKNKANLELRKEKGENLDRDDYNNIISLSEQNEKLAEEELEAYKKVYEDNKANLSDDEKKEALAEIQNLEKAVSEAKKETIELRKEAIQEEIDNTQALIDKLETQNELLTNAQEKNENINQQIEYTKEYYDLLIEQETNATKQAELRAEKEKTILDYLKEQLDNIQEQSDRFVNLRESMQNQVEESLSLQEETGKDTVNSRVWSYSWRQNNQNQIASERHNEASEMYKNLHSSDYGFYGEDGIFYVWENMLNAFNEGMTEYWNTEAEALKAEADSAQLAYTIWEEEYLNPKLDAYKLLQSEAEVLESDISLKEFKGIKADETDYKKLIDSSKEQISNLKSLNETYKQKQMEYEVGSTKWKEMQEFIDDNNKSINNAIKSQEEWNQAILNLPLNKIEEELDLLDSITSKLEAQITFKEAKGLELYADDYFSQIEQKRQEINKHSNQKRIYMDYYLKALNSSEGVYDGQNSDYWLQQINSVDAEILNTQTSIEELKKSLRDDVYWRDFEKMHTSLENVARVLSNISSLMNEDMYYNDDGTMTEYGVAQLSNYIKQYENARKQVEAYQDDIENLNDLYRKGYYTTDEYNEKMVELQNGMLESANTMNSTQSSIMDMMKKQSEEELNHIFELIDARNDLLNKTKEYYDYTKNVQNQTKDINAIKAQMASLQGVEGSEAKARMKQLEEQLNEAESNLEDTVNEHILELSTESLDDLKETLQDMYDDEIKDMSANLETIAEYMGIANNLTSSSSMAIQATLNKLLKHYGIEPSSISGYAIGTKSVDKNKLAWTQENGSEIIVRKSDGAILTPLNKGDGVIPNNLTENLYEWGSYNPSDFLNNLNGLLDTLPMDTSKPISVTTQYDSLLRVEGNVDREALPDLQTILQKSYEYNVKETTKNLKYAGYKPKF